MSISTIATSIIGAINSAKKGIKFENGWTMHESFRVAPMSKGRSRFHIGKITGFVAIRKHKSRGYCVESGEVFTQIHLGKVTVAVENNRGKRRTWNFAGN